MDFFADEIWKKCYREVIEDMTSNGYWDDDKRRIEQLATWKYTTKLLLKNVPFVKLLSILEDCIYEVSDDQHKSDKIFRETQKSYKISIAKRKNPGARGKFRKLIDSKIKITNVAKKYGLDVKKNKALCPFHADGTPSLSFNDEKNVFNCFGCGAKGDIIEFVRRMEA